MTDNIVYKKTKNVSGPAKFLADRINQNLAAGKSVSFFISGGSAINVAVEAAGLINNGSLTVSLVDERYGAAGHPDSNWQQLLDAGFNIEGARLEPVLFGNDQQPTRAAYSSVIERMLAADYKLALLGIGTDGHTAGILPGSEAVRSGDLTCLYEAGNYTRLTMTPTALAKLDEAVVYAVGEEKRQALLNLAKNIAIADEPAQVLKQIPLVTVYNDLVGEEIMRIAVSGLGRMGSQISRKLSEAGHEVIATNRSRPPIDEAARYGAVAAYDKESAVHSFGESQAVIWIMLPADIIDGEIDAWLKIIPTGSILIDGGNSNYKLDRRRAERVNAAGSYYIDIGTSGGVWGYKNGFAMMAGGDRAAFEAIEPALQALAKPHGGYAYFGASGSGHFVKMVHNAIEYGMMESLAEGYRMLKEGPYKDLDLAAAGEVWQNSSVVTSWLNSLAAEALKENPQLEGIDGVVAETGETRWTLELADEIKLPMPAIKASFDVRLNSQKGEVNFATRLLAAMRYKFGGHDLNPK